ncbi:glycosyltransferase [Candidatus Mesenet endosymbiont of Agriotes lineatus]|uniref:glycosyltransferase n=1 Tax=Candidatus Mesenet endosymbiont of Agriotes lineatus TaxID=3077948 RepID=UPI0030CAA1C0
MLKNNDNVVSKNLPIYFIWFGSDVPPKYFGNLQRTAETNKSRDIILVYSREHLPENNRKNIDSMESISIDDIKTKVALERNSNTKNLFKIDVYKMELDKQDERIYDLYKQMFEQNTFLGKSYPLCATSDIIRLPLINITGGIYFDMDTKVTGEIGDLDSKYGFDFNNYFDNIKLDVAAADILST